MLTGKKTGKTTAVENKKVKPLITVSRDLNRKVLEDKRVDYLQRGVKLLTPIMGYKEFQKKYPKLAESGNLGNLEDLDRMHYMVIERTIDIEKEGRKKGFNTY